MYIAGSGWNIRSGWGCNIMQLYFKQIWTYSKCKARSLWDRRRRGRDTRRWGSRAWLGWKRRRQYGLYDQLIVELQTEDAKSLEQFLRIPYEMFQETLMRISPKWSSYVLGTVNQLIQVWSWLSPSITWQPKLNTETCDLAGELRIIQYRSLYEREVIDMILFL